MLLFSIVRGICSGNQDIQSRLNSYISRLCKGYLNLYEKQSESKTLKNAQKDEFFGLRDFYRLELTFPVITSRLTLFST